MRLTGAFFDLTDRFAPSPTADHRSTRGANALRGAGASRGNDVRRAGGRRDKVLISVAKRLVASAVRRNTVKRIVREAWRAALRAEAGAGRATNQSNPHGARTGSAEQIEPESGQAGSGHGAQPDSAQPGSAQPGSTQAGDVVEDPGLGLVCLVRLKRNPGFDARPRPAAPGRAGPGPAAPGLVVIKRILREDADKLFAAYLQGRSRQRRVRRMAPGRIDVGPKEPQSR